MNNGDNRHNALFDPINDSIAEGKDFPKAGVPHFGDDSARQGMLTQVPGRRYHLGYNGAGVERRVFRDIFCNGLDVGQRLGRLFDEPFFQASLRLLLRQCPLFLRNLKAVLDLLKDIQMILHVFQGAVFRKFVQ